MKNYVKVLRLWILLRWEEGRRPRWSPSGAKGLSLVDGALAMAAVRVPMQDVRFLIACGADPSVHKWLPMRMAAANGDVELIAWLRELSEPSDYALEDALNWAKGKGQLETITLLENEISRRLNSTR